MCSCTNNHLKFQSYFKSHFVLPTVDAGKYRNKVHGIERKRKPYHRFALRTHFYEQNANIG